VIEQIHRLVGLYQQVVANPPWTDWSGFWVQYVLLGFDPRFLVVYCLPLVGILLLFPRKHLRLGLVLTNIAFMGYLFGLLFVPYWFMFIIFYYWLAERYDRDLKRQEQLWWNPTIAVIILLFVGFIWQLGLAGIRIPSELNRWIFEHLPWVFPLGARKVAWEPYFLPIAENIESRPPQLYFTIFCLPQISGFVILTIRMMSYFSEIKRGTIPREKRTFWRFLAFNSFCPLNMQGPIERYKEFNERLDAAHDRRSWYGAATGLFRIALGIVKNLFCLFFLTPSLLPNIFPVYYAHPEQVDNYWMLFGWIHLEVLWLYLMFSGYCDVAIGAAQ